MNELKITITGSVASGKSTMSRLLTELLISGGFEVENQEFDEMLFPVDSDTQAQRVCSLLDKETKIIIDSEQEQRHCSVKYVQFQDGEVKEIDAQSSL